TRARTREIRQEGSAMASIRRAHVLGGSAFALALLGLAVPRAMTHHRTAAAPVAHAAASAAVAPVTAEQGPAARRWPAGLAFVYAMDSTWVLSKPEGGEHAGGLTSTIAGQLAVAVVEAEADVVRLRLELRAPRHADAKGFELDDAELSRGFYADAGPDGRF